MSNLLEKSFLENFFEKIKELEYCILRNFETLPNNVPGSDIDILINKMHFKFFQQALIDSAHEKGYQIVSKYRKDYKITHIKIFNENNFSFLRFDLMTAIGASGIEILNYEKLRPFVINKKVMNILNNPSSLAVTLLQNWVSKRGYLKKKYFEKIKKLNLDERKLFCKIISEIVNYKQCRALFEIEKFEDLNNYLLLSRRKILYKIFIKKPQLLGKKFIQKTSLLFHRILNKPGKFIVLLGPDGSGKSTIAREVKKQLLKFYPNIVYEHLSPKLLPRLQEVKNFFFDKKVDSLKEISEWEIRNKKHGFIKSLISMFYYSINYTIGYLLIVYPHLLKGDLVIFDRYFYDYLYDPKSKGITLPFVIRRVFTIFYPKPDKVIVISVRPEILLSRKNEIPYEEIVLQQNRMSYLIERYDNFIEVENNNGIENCVQTIVKEIALL